MAGAWLPRYRTRSALAATSSSWLTPAGPVGAFITAFMLLRWSAATMRIAPESVLIVAMARRSAVVIVFTGTSPWVGGSVRRWADRRWCGGRQAETRSRAASWEAP